VFSRSIHEIERQASYDNAEILDIFSVTPDICEIEVGNISKVKPSQSGSLYLTAQINALARRFIYEKSELIEASGGIILSIDTGISY